MAEKVLMIALSPTMEEGTIVRWNKKEGETVGSGDLLCEVETDKATMDYESPLEGTLLKVLVPEGGSAKVADPIAIMGEKGEDISALLEEVAAEEALKPAAVIQEPGVSTAAALTSTMRASGEPVEPAPMRAARAKASPLARKMARESGVDLNMVSGTGPDGRIVKRDIEGRRHSELSIPIADLPSPGEPLVGMPAVVEERIPVTGKRKVIAQRLAESKLQAPHYYLRLSIAMDGIMSARARLNAGLEERVSLNAFIIKFVAEALKKHGMVNSSWQEDHILKFGTIDIGLAVAVPDGLITPVVRDCGSRGILAIESDLKVLIPKAREGKLLPEEYKGATFTITNLGAFGIEDFTAIINPPGSAILALGAIQKQQVIVTSETGEDTTQIRSLMKVTMSCDHRVIDGATGAGFLSSLKAMMENPIEVLY
jgi:pyruvate dehydrogenase E2 component (dihydrolipoamide acetyltransferase)